MFFPKQFTVRGSQCFKEWSPWCWMVWSGSRLACLQLAFICLPVLFICLLLLFICLPGCCLWSGSRLACLPLAFICLPLLFICLPVLFICLPGWVLVVGFLAGLSPTSFHLSPSSFHLSPRLGACGRVPGWLVCNLLSFVSQFFSFVSQAGWLWSGSRLACLPHPFMCLPVLFICLPVLFICLPGSVLVVGFLASLSPTCFHLSPTSFHLSPRLGACGRVPGWLVSHFLSCVSQFFSFVSQFFSFVSQAGCLWAGSWLACLPLPFMCLPVLFICLPGWVLVVGLAAGFFPPGCSLWSGSGLACLPLAFMCLPILFICGWLVSHFHLSPTSFHLSPRLGACGQVPGWLVSNFLHSGSRPACLPLPFICLPVLFICPPGWVLVVGFPAGLSPISFHLFPSSFHLSPRLGACGRVCLPGWVLVVGFLASLSPTCFHLSPTSFHLSPRLGACGRVPGWLVSHFLSCVSQFFSFVSQWAGSWLACLPLPFMCLPVRLVPPRLFLVVGFRARLSPTCFHVSPNSFHLRLAGLSPGWLVSHFLSFPNSHAMGSCKTNRRTGAVGSPSELVGGWCPGHVLMASGSCDAGVPVSRSCFDCDPIML